MAVHCEMRTDDKGAAMRRKHWPWYALTLAAGIGGLLWAGVPTSTLALAAMVLVCPLMMLFMHGGGHGGHDHADRARPQRPEESADSHAHHDRMTGVR
jgi:hypothetical protein